MTKKMRIKKLGLVFEKVEARWEQGGECAVCGRPIDSEKDRTAYNLGQWIVCRICKKGMLRVLEK